ncbi:hypothetical protein [Aureimonas psammosilenae]|uniref:hypothetical protein n=1 Tax=Aureimonas psammosilenae TaxID=2495496 RepID=UPI00186A4E45|nr:hypothetical protein [Aureimonas psammosilenae]
MLKIYDIHAGLSYDLRRHGVIASAKKLRPLFLRFSPAYRMNCSTSVHQPCVDVMWFV